MPNKSLSIEQVLTILDDAPRRLAALTDGVDPARLHARPDDDEWSINEILAHLRACGDIWGECMEMMIAQDAPTIRARNPRTWIRSTDYTEQEFVVSLRAFAEQRASFRTTRRPPAQR